MNMSFNRLTGHGSKGNFIQTDVKICEKTSAKFSSFSYTSNSDLVWRLSEQFCDAYHHTEFERDQSVNVQMQASI